MFHNIGLVPVVGFGPTPIHADYGCVPFTATLV